MYYLEAIDKNGKLRNLGKELCKFPLEPTFGKCLLASYRLGCESDMTKLVSILSSESLWLMVSKNDENG